MELRDTCIDWVRGIFGTGLFDDVQGILLLNPSSGLYRDVWNIVSSLYTNVCVPIAMGLVLIYFMVNIIEKSTQQQSLDLEHIIKLLMKLVLGLYLIEHGLEIMAEFYSLGLSFLQSVIGEAKAAYKANDLIESAWYGLTGEGLTGSWGTLESLGKFMDLFWDLGIPFIVIKILTVVVNFVCYTRLIEFYLRTATAPIALSDFFTEGVHSNGWKFLKSYIAVALQAGIIMLAVVVFNAIASALLGSSPDLSGGNYWSFMVKYLALAFATAGLMIKSLSLTKEIVGA